MTKLNQIVALEKGLKGRTEKAITKTYHQLQKAEPFAGLSRTYQPKDEDGDVFPPERTQVQETVPDQLDQAAKALTELFNVVATKEWGNTIARADVKIDGQVIVEGAPVPYLLFLEKRLIDWRTMVSTLPTLNPAEVWTADETANNQYRTEATKTTKTKKIPRVLTKAPATERHPAQTEVYMEDVVIGEWSTTKFSGAIPAKRRDELVERVNKLIDAVQMAREDANDAEIEQKRPAAAVFSYLLA
jgi:hypothetical protein